ncbi:TerD family protein [Candidatus Protofrankia californiensis]|uniref:TerD family protein n=1 Tax=Candidatus Protofrankia californiensis TaxID=1839754 RepID=UPI0019CFBEF4
MRSLISRLPREWTPLSALADELGSVSVILERAAEKGHPLDADVSVLLLGDDGKVRSNDDFVFYNQPSGAAETPATDRPRSSCSPERVAFRQVSRS